jgi:hypothetical protein
MTITSMAHISQEIRNAHRFGTFEVIVNDSVRWAGEAKDRDEAIQKAQREGKINDGLAKKYQEGRPGIKVVQKRGAVDRTDWKHANDIETNPFNRHSANIRNAHRFAEKADPEPTGEKLPGGEADGRPDSDFDPASLEAGIAVEMEHTTDRDIAKEIAKDHLTEDPAYYEKLAKMEPESREVYMSARAQPARFAAPVFDKESYLLPSGKRIKVAYKDDGSVEYISGPSGIKYGEAAKKELEDLYARGIIRFASNAFNQAKATVDILKSLSSPWANDAIARVLESDFSGATEILKQHASHPIASRALGLIASFCQA